MFGERITHVITGGARGIDKAAEVWAKKNNIPVTVMLANWDKFGKAEAGAIRNREMADRGEALIAIWDGYSSGAKHMIAVAEARDLRVFVYRP